MTTAHHLCVKTNTAGDRVVIAITGQLDVTNRQELATAVSEANNTEIRLIELWVMNLQVCDAAGLGVIVGLHHAARIEGKVLRLRNPSAELTRVLEINGLRELLVGDDANNGA